MKKIMWIVAVLPVVVASMMLQVIPDMIPHKILLMFVKQIFEDFENLENKKESNLNKTCCCRPAVNSYNESGQIYLYNSIARA